MSELKYFICENSDSCLNKVCFMTLPRGCEKGATHCETFAGNVADKEITAAEAKEILYEKYPELLGSIASI